MAENKIFAGPRVRRIRNAQGQTQTAMAEALVDLSTIGPQQCSAKFETAVQDRDPSATTVDDLKGVETAIAYLRDTYCAGGAG